MGKVTFVNQNWNGDSASRFLEQFLVRRQKIRASAYVEMAPLPFLADWWFVRSARWVVRAHYDKEAYDQWWSLDQSFQERDMDTEAEWERLDEAVREYVCFLPKEVPPDSPAQAIHARFCPTPEVDAFIEASLQRYHQQAASRIQFMFEGSVNERLK
jgi:hypothetical protein